MKSQPAAPELVTLQGWWESNKQQCRSAEEHQQQAELAVGEAEQVKKVHRHYKMGLRLDGEMEIAFLQQSVN